MGMPELAGRILLWGGRGCTLAISKLSGIRLRKLEKSLICNPRELAGLVKISASRQLQSVPVVPPRSSGALFHPQLSQGESPMNRLTNLSKSFIEEQDGAVVTEYGMLIVVLVLGLVIALGAFRSKIVSWFNSIGTNLQNLNSTSG